jgi:hypothetical protein
MGMRSHLRPPREVILMVHQLPPPRAGLSDDAAGRRYSSALRR